MARSFLRLQKFDLNGVNLLKFTEIQGKRVQVKFGYAMDFATS